MNKQRLLITISLALAIAAPWGVGRAFGQTQQDQRQTIVDASGRVHKVMPMRSITHEQRRAAAQHRKSRAAHAGHHKKHTAPASQGEVTQ